MPLKFVTDGLDDGRHQHLDDLVFKGLGLTPEILPRLPPGLFPPALWRIVKDLPEKLDQKYTDMAAAEQLLNDLPELANLFEEAWASGTFRRIRNLEVLRAVTPHKSKRTRMSNKQVEEQKTATLHAWNTPFMGQAHELLALTVHAMNRTRGDSPYANYLPIIQSSGTGKSRTVHELARLVFTIPFNLRGDDENSGYAYPPPDPSIRDYLTRKLFPMDEEKLPLKQDARPSYDDVTGAYLVFLAELFKVIRANLKKNINRQRTAEDLASAWREYLNADEDNGIPPVRWSIYNEVTTTLLVRKQANAKNSELAKDAQREISQLESDIDLLLSTKPPTGDVRILLYFDEAHSLSNIAVNDDPGGRNYYDALCSALSLLSECQLFAITLSTNSNLSRFSPTKRAHHSNRVHKGKDTLQAPYTELLFDCLEKGQPFIHPGEMTLAQVAEVGFMVKFGRPLFRTRWNSANHLPSVRHDMIDFARAKLTGRTSNEADADGKDNHAKRARLAAFSTRLLLEFEPRREASLSMEAELVEGNMRMAYSVPKHREYVRSGTPSEPILAEAAAQEMNEMTRPIPDILAEFIRDGLIDKGESGELVMRLLLTEAWSLAAKKTCARDGVPLSFSRAVHLFDFLRELFGEKHLQAILKSRSDNDSDSGSFQEVFGNAFLRFSHFARNGKDNPTTTHTAWAAVARGMAIQCSRNQHMIDAMLPLVLWDEKLCEEIMSGILIQVKNKEDAEVILIDESQIGQGMGFFPKDRPDDHRPYITLVMQLGVQTKASRDALSATVSQESQKGPTMKPRAYKTPSKISLRTRQALRASAPHPRYAIHVIGCSRAVYNVVESKDQYSVILGGRDILDEHPRQFPGSLAAVRRFKPFWNPGPDCYDWIDDPELNRRIDLEEQGDKLLTGADAVRSIFFEDEMREGDEEMELLDPFL